VRSEIHISLDESASVWGLVLAKLRIFLFMPTFMWNNFRFFQQKHRFEQTSEVIGF